MGSTRNMLNKDFKYLLTADLISSFGSNMTNVALTMYIFKISDSLLTASLFPLVSILPKLLLTPFMNRIKIKGSYRTFFSLGEITAGLIMISLIWIKSVPALLIFYAIFSFVFFILEMYRAEYLKVISDDETIYKMQSVSRTMNVFIKIIGPLAAGYILLCFSVETIYITDFITYIIASLVILKINKEEKMIVNTEKCEKEIKQEKTKKMKRTKLLNSNSHIYIGTTAISFIGGITSLLTLSYIINFLKAGEESYGILMALMSGGATIGSMLVNVKHLKEHKEIYSPFGIMLSGVLLLTVMFRPGIVPLGIILFVSGIISSFVMTIYAIEIYTMYTREEIKGKYAFFTLLIDSSTAGSKPSAGILEKYFGSIISIVIMGITFIGFSVVNFFLRRIRE